MGTQIRLPQSGTADPQFSVNVGCGQKAGWIKMSLSMEVGLGPDHIVLDWDAAPPFPNWQTPNFRPMSVVAKRLDGSRCHLVGMETSSQGIQLPQNGHSTPTLFGLCLLWPNGWMDQDAG